MYDFSRFAHETQCIIVSISYRVNIFGFLGSRALSGESPGDHPLPASIWSNQLLKDFYQNRNSNGIGIGSGNYGIWDVLAGLEWVSNNIKYFGGDAQSITAFGESAGAILLDYVLQIPSQLLPKDFKLFHRTILQSGSVWTVLPRSIESAQATFDALMKISGAQDLEELRKKDGNELREIVEQFKAMRPRTEFQYDEEVGKFRCDLKSEEKVFEEMSLLGPIWDGLLVPKDIKEKIQNRSQAANGNGLGEKGLMLGYMVDEGSMFNLQINTPEKLKAHADGFHINSKKAIKKAYGVESAADAGEAFSICSAYTVSCVLSSRS